MKQKKWKLNKVLAATVVLTLCVAILTACSGQKSLSSDFDTDKVKEATTKVITAVNEQDGDALREISDDSLKTALTDEALAPVFQAIAEGGVFQEVKETNISSSTDPKTNVEYAVAVAKAQYEKKAFVYTISFTKDMKLAGLFYK